MQPILSKEMTLAPVKKSKYTTPIVYLDELWVQCCIHIPYLRDYYWISNQGRMYSGIQNSIISPNVELNSGYCRITSMAVDGREVRRFFHRLVMESFCWFDGCYEYDVNHIDGVKTNNWLCNLEWATKSENIQHALRMGLKPSGENCNLAKYSNEQVIRIADLLMQEMRYEDICNIVFGECNDIYIHLVSNIANKHCWNFLTTDYDFPTYRTHKQLLSDQTLDSIYQYHLLNPNASYRDICRIYVRNFDNLDKDAQSKYVTVISSLFKHKLYDHIYSKYV